MSGRRIIFRYTRAASVGLFIGGYVIYIWARSGGQPATLCASRTESTHSIYQLPQVRYIVSVYQLPQVRYIVSVYGGAHIDSKGMP